MKFVGPVHNLNVIMYLAELMVVGTFVFWDCVFYAGTVSTFADDVYQRFSEKKKRPVCPSKVPFFWAKI